MRAHSLCVVQTYLSTQTIHHGKVSAARKHHRVVLLPYTREGRERPLLRIVGKTKRRFAVEVVGVGVRDRRRQTQAGEERRRGCHECDLFLRSNVERLLFKSPSDAMEVRFVCEDLYRVVDFFFRNADCICVV